MTLSHERQESPRRCRGQVVVISSFDIAYDMKRQPVKRLLGQPVKQFAVGPVRHAPREMLFFRPQMAELPPVERVGPGGPVQVERTVKLFPVGAVSITVRVPFEVERLDELLCYHELRFEEGSLEEEVQGLAASLAAELAPFCVRPVETLAEAETYTVFCITTPECLRDGDVPDTEAWLAKYRREVAALLTEEADPAGLSRQEMEESTERFLSYYEGDLVVVDWDAALIIEQERNLEEILHVMELANVQLAELKAYDRLLDASLGRSYRHLGARKRRRGQRELQQLREMRIDLARLSDELSNITKFFGDWHLARIYRNLNARFHLPDWTRTITQKLRTLDELYQLLKQDQTNRWMLILESAIVLLFIIDVIVILLGIGGR